MTILPSIATSLRKKIQQMAVHVSPSKSKQASTQFLDGPGRREAAGRHCGRHGTRSSCSTSSSGTTTSLMSPPPAAAASCLATWRHVDRWRWPSGKCCISARTSASIASFMTWEMMPFMSEKPEIPRTRARMIMHGPAGGECLPLKSRGKSLTLNLLTVC
jgi:hypothetical protein